MKLALSILVLLGSCRSSPPSPPPPPLPPTTQAQADAAQDAYWSSVDTYLARVLDWQIAVDGGAPGIVEEARISQAGAIAMDKYRKLLSVLERLQPEPGNPEDP